MMSRSIRASFFVGLASLCLLTGCAKDGGGTGTDARPPIARRIPKQIVQHGETRVDEYFWLRDKENPEVINYLKAENAYTEAVMAPAKDLEERLFKEIVARIKEDDQDVPYRKGNWLYYTRTETGKQYPIYCRKPYRHPGESAPAPAESVTIDVNELARDKEFFEIGEYQVSDDGNLLAYTQDTAGSREFVLYVKDLRTGQTLKEKIEHVADAEWAADNQTIYYVIEDDAKRPYRLMRHTLGSGGKDELVYEEADRLYELSVGRTRMGQYIIVTSASKTTSEIRIIPADRADAKPALVAPRREGHEYYVDQQGGHLYIKTNDKGPNFRLVRVPAADPSPAKWEEVVAHRDDVVLEGFDCFAGGIALFERASAAPRLRILDPATGQAAAVELPEALCAVNASVNEEYTAGQVRIGYQSMVTPGSTYEVDLKTRKLTLLKRREVLGGYDPSKYVTERLFATAADGAKVPVSIVRRKDFSGHRPLKLYGYGAYGFPQEMSFSSTDLSLLDRGVTLAVAHPRGGGDFGRRWYDAGRMMNKPNTFTDFIAAADLLVKAGYTTRRELAIEGASAGGLLIGAVLNLRPNLCRVALLDMPFVDVLNTMSDDTLPLTTQEWIEWGNPNLKPEYDSIKRYCPYTNINATAYPAMLVRTGLNDSQVLFHEPAKYVAKMRATRTDKNTLLLKANMGAGHGGTSGRYDALREVAFQYAFLLRELGVEK